MTEDEKTERIKYLENELKDANLLIEDAIEVIHHYKARDLNHASIVIEHKADKFLKGIGQ